MTYEGSIMQEATQVNSDVIVSARLPAISSAALLEYDWWVVTQSNLVEWPLL